jgi:hypothetical protein
MGISENPSTYVYLKEFHQLIPVDLETKKPSLRSIQELLYSISVSSNSYYGRIGSDIFDQLLKSHILSIREIKGKEKRLKVIILNLRILRFTLIGPFLVLAN